MTYASGEEVCEGDLVRIRHAGYDAAGVVVKVILPDTEDAKTWNAPAGGILISGGGLGMSLSTDLSNDEDVIFVSRKAKGRS